MAAGVATPPPTKNGGGKGRAYNWGEDLRERERKEKEEEMFMDEILRTATYIINNQ